MGKFVKKIMLSIVAAALMIMRDISISPEHRNRRRLLSTD